MIIQTQERIKIAIAGHTNVGKTTLIRTLMKAKIGEVRDEANVTETSVAYDGHEYDGLQAKFIDTPGFQNTIAINMFEKDPGFKPTKEMEKDWSFDLTAIEAIKNSDVVLYLGSLEVVPDSTQKAEISIIIKKQPRVIAILSKYNKELKASSQEEVDRRINLWKKSFNSQGINHTIVYDACWDKPSKITEIYETIEKILDPEKREIFVTGLNLFKTRVKDIREAACNNLAMCINQCQKNATESIKKLELDKGEKEAEIRKNLTKELDEIYGFFVYKTSILYKIAAEKPTASKNELNNLLELELQKYPNFLARLGMASSAATFLGSFAAIVGAGMGAIVVGFLTGGIGVGGAALLGAQTIGLIGAGLGTLAIFVDQEDTVKISVKQKEIETLVATGIALIWGLSNHGYGSEQDLSQEKIDKIKSFVKNLQKEESSRRSIDWMQANREDIAKYCEKILNKLEDAEF